MSIVSFFISPKQIKLYFDEVSKWFPISPHKNIIIPIKRRDQIIPYEFKNMSRAMVQKTQKLLYNRDVPEKGSNMLNKIWFRLIISLVYNCLNLGSLLILGRIEAPKMRCSTYLPKDTP